MEELCYLFCLIKKPALLCQLENKCFTHRENGTKHFYGSCECILCLTVKRRINNRGIHKEGESILELGRSEPPLLTGSLTECCEHNIHYLIHVLSSTSRKDTVYERDVTIVSHGVGIIANMKGIRWNGGNLPTITTLLVE